LATRFHSTLFTCMGLIPWFVGLIWLLVIGLPVSIVQQKDFSIPCPPIAQDLSVSQSFTCSGAGFQSIALRFGTYRRVNHGLIKGTISVKKSRDSSANLERQFDIPLDALEDNQWHTITFLPLFPAAESEGVITLHGVDIPPGNEVTLWQTQDDAYPPGHLSFGDRRLSGDAAFKIIGQVRSTDLLKLWIDRWKKAKSGWYFIIWIPFLLTVILLSALLILHHRLGND
jgi:hypothetical protein